MRYVPAIRRSASFAVVGLFTVLSLACSDLSEAPVTGPAGELASLGGPQEVPAAIAAQERHTDALLRIPGVVGTAVGLLPNGRAAVKVLVENSAVRVPETLDGVPVAREVVGMFVAFSDPTSRLRPAPVGFSIGHPDITAGTIGARVVDGSGNVFVLSNNHVLANTNAASVGDPVLQPGPFDGGTLADQIGTLSAFAPIDFSSRGRNTIDAAIASSTSSLLDNSTPSDDGYGTPSSDLFGDANGDGQFDDRNALLGLFVQKYGRTTGHTHGQITGVNAKVTICYEVVFVWCTLSAKFVDQLIITPGTFSGGGDSGSLIVTDDGNANPVGLLFAGSSAETIANRIDLVLNHFGVSIDGGETPPPAPVTDIAITGIDLPAVVTEGSAVDVVVTVQNVGNQDVGASFDVSLDDLTDAVAIGTQTVAGLTAGAVAELTFPWNTTGSSLGDHTLSAAHDLGDDNAGNDEASAGVEVAEEVVVAGIHVGDLDGSTTNDGSTWSAIVEVTVHDTSHNPLNGVTVVGVWSESGLASDTCTTGELGGDGTCIFLFPGIRKRVSSVSFTVTSVTKAGETYDPAGNHDVDGSSDGTTVVVNR